MIKKTIILISILTLWTSLHSQIGKFEIGIEGGPSLISLRGNKIIKETNITTIGFSSGVSFQYNFPKLVSIRTNITFERKGFRSDLSVSNAYNEPLGELKYRSNFDYLIIPVLTRFHFGNKIKFFANAGPYFAYLIKQTEIIDSNNESQNSNIDNIDRFNRYDFGVSGGLGFRLSIQNNIFMTTEVRHNLGLHNISQLPIINDGKISTNSTNLLLGFAYHIGR